MQVLVAVSRYGVELIGSQEVQVDGVPLQVRQLVLHA